VTAVLALEGLKAPHQERRASLSSRWYRAAFSSTIACTSGRVPWARAGYIASQGSPAFPLVQKISVRSCQRWCIGGHPSGIASRPHQVRLSCSISAAVQRGYRSRMACTRGARGPTLEIGDRGLRS